MEVYLYLLFGILFCALSFIIGAHVGAERLHKRLFSKMRAMQNLFVSEFLELEADNDGERGLN